ncbi:MAG: helix-turn-helix domain-containing protein [Chitinophagaceae bacterium]|uniref:helix-turn-helix domain-containing protein n=1 Tax=unclassified Paraflavitalea TaxID=2798305 RepID=UPI003D33AAD4|nr:helix-turn-helix domain-containing protein [Chitinophagaceae bacterium]
MTPGIWIKRLRLTKDMKQTAIAKKMGITQQAYSKIENSLWIRKGRLPQILSALESNIEELTKVGELFKKKDVISMEFQEPEMKMRA